jgi:beta-lactamase class A
MTLLQDIEQIIQDVKVDFGISIFYIELGNGVMFNADKAYHLASVVKIPIMVEAFRQIEIEKTLVLEERLKLNDSFKLSGTGILKFLDEGLTPTVEDLITLMTIISDNTATDTILERLGGPMKVDATMKALGLDDIHTKMTIRQAHWDRGMRKEPLIDPREAVRARKEMKLIFDSACYTASPEGNSATPQAMTELIRRIYSREIWSKRACDKMMEIMYKQQRNTRIPSKLPRGTLVAHKTGTITGVANDAGIIEIDGDNHCAITIFTRDEEFMEHRDPVKAGEKSPIVESIMGDIALLAYNHGKTLAS